jgi:hypothetical protein
MRWTIQKVIDPALFDYSSSVHNSDTIAHASDDPEVVCYEDNSDTQVRLE